MAKFGKWIGGGLGFTLGGPLGALAGFCLGSIIDEAENFIQPSIVPITGKAQITVIGNYNCSLFRKLSAQKMATKMLSHQI